MPTPLVTFNVVFTRGSVSRLLPFSLSLLLDPDVRIRLVANGCTPEEVELIEAVTERHERVSRHLLPNAETVEHGHALNHLFEAFPEPRFAFVDSDVIANGDFMKGLRPDGPGLAGTFTAPAVWITDQEAMSTPGTYVLSGGRRTLDDGTYVGNTYCAIYEREILEPVWRAAPRGFAAHHRHLLSREVRATLAARGWLFRTFDTARLINLQLLLAGYRLEPRRVPELHHVGGFSVRDFYGARGKARRLLSVLRSSPDGRARRIADGIASNVYSKLQPDPTSRRRQQRRWRVLSYLDTVIDAVLAEEPAPPPLRTDSADVDERVAELAAAIRTQYPRGIALMRGAPRTPAAGHVA